MVSSNVLIEEESFYTNVLHVESVEKEYQEGNSKDQLIQVRVTVKISVEDAYQNRSEKYVTVLVEIRDASGLRVGRSAKNSSVDGERGRVVFTETTICREGMISFVRII